MLDYYLADRQRLLDQPKRVIGAYVEQQGILVPRRFDTRTQAQHAGVPIIARTEHPQDYDGASGLLDSPVFKAGEDIPAADVLRESLLADANVAVSYFPLIGQPESLQDFSFSLWEYLPGYNRTVIADSSIPNRYHVTTFSGFTAPDGYVRQHNYSIVEDENCILSAGRKLLPFLSDRLSQLIATYERIRNLERFDANHCPLIEFQSTYDADYFLQYLRTRDFEPATFELDPREPGDCPVLFTRGATPPGGVELDVTLVHGYSRSPLHWKGKFSRWPFPAVEDGALDDHWNWAYVKAMLPKRKLQLMREKNRDWHLFKVAVEHEMRETLYRPPVTLVVDSDALSNLVSDGLVEECKRTGEDAKVRMHVISDGRNAVLKRVLPS